MTISQTDLAYAAGIIDGEGCIHIVTVKPGRHQMRVAVRTGDLVICAWLYHTFGGCLDIIPRKVADPSLSDNLCWHMNGKKAAAFLSVIFPYLKLKKPQAEVGIAFAKTVLTHGGAARHAGLSDEVIETRENYYKQMRTLNQRGGLSLTA